MRWLGLLPLILHLMSVFLFYKIATIRVGFRWWYMAWGILSSVAAASGWARLMAVLRGVPLSLEPMIAPTYVATGLWLFGLIMWGILKSRPPAVPIPVAQVVMTWQGRIVLWNTAAEDLLGWTAAEAVGEDLADLCIPEDLMVEFHGEQIFAREAHRRGLRHFRNTGESPILDTRFRTVARHRDGHPLDVEIRVNAHMTPEGTTFLGQIVPITPGIPKL